MLQMANRRHFEQEALKPHQKPTHVFSSLHSEPHCCHPPSPDKRGPFQSVQMGRQLTLLFCLRASTQRYSTHTQQMASSQQQEITNDAPNQQELASQSKHPHGFAGLACLFAAESIHASQATSSNLQPAPGQSATHRAVCVAVSLALRESATGPIRIETHLPPRTRPQRTQIARVFGAINQAREHAACPFYPRLVLGAL